MLADFGGYEPAFPPHECEEVRWGLVMRVIQAYPDRYPDRLLEAAKFCRDTHERRDWCSDTLLPIYHDYNTHWVEKSKRERAIQRLQN